MAIFDTVDIEGSEVSRASLHNISVMNDIMGDVRWKGQKIGVYKANLIIPAIRWAEQAEPFKDVEEEMYDEIDIPDKCPICSHLTKIIKENNSEVLYCANEDCKGRLLGKLTHATSKSALNIDGLSEETLEKFIDAGYIKEFADIRGYNREIHQS